MVGACVAQLALVTLLYPQLRSSGTYKAFSRSSACSSSYVLELMRWGVRVGTPMAFLGGLHFAQANGWGVRRPCTSRRGHLPTYPGQLASLGLVLGEQHQPDGAPVRLARLADGGERALYAGVLITGAIGTGKTEGCIYPFLRQLLGFHPDDPARKVGSASFWTPRETW